MCHPVTWVTGRSDTWVTLLINAHCATILKLQYRLNSDAEYLRKQCASNCLSGSCGKIGGKKNWPIADLLLASR